MAVATEGQTASLIEERRARGLDRFDEMWNGVLHMNPPPKRDHQRVATRLAHALIPVADAHGFDVLMEAGLFDPVGGELDYRQPDVMVFGPEHAVERGVEGGCALVVEGRSPHDETYLKFDFYAASNVEQIMVIEPSTRTAEFYGLVDRRYGAIQPVDGELVLGCLPVSVGTVERGGGPRLHIVTPFGESFL